MYDCSGKEGVFIVVWVSVFMPESECDWTAYGLV